MLKCCSIGLFFLVSTVLNSKPSENWTGKWAGVLEFNGNSLNVMFEINVKNSGWYTKLYVPDQQVYGFAMSSTTLNKKDVSISSDFLGIQFSGHKTDSSTVKGTFIQNGQTLPLKLTRIWGVWPKSKPQTPIAPFTYLSEKLKLPVSNGRISLAGTLTLPDSSGIFPLIVLISGSGSQDRDCSIGNHKPFWVIADYFSSRGFAVFRYDDRGVSASKGHPNTIANSTTLDIADDVCLILDLLKYHKNIDSNQLILMGHSEGGVIAPLVGERRHDLYKVVLLAAPAITGLEINMAQNTEVLKNVGYKKRHIESFIAIHRKLLLATTQIADTILWKHTMDSLIRHWEKHGATQKARKLLFKEKNQPISTVIDSYYTFKIPWWQYFLTHDPAPVLAKIQCPVLALNGYRDFQVSADVNIPMIRSKLQNPQSECLVIPGLNHLFQTCTTCTIAEYFTLDESFSIGTLDLVERWLLKKP